MNQNHSSIRINNKILKETTTPSSTSTTTTQNMNRRNSQIEANENEFESQTPINFPPPRTPLNSIPDPSQYHEPEPIRHRRSSSDRFGNAASVRVAKLHSEPNTPARVSSSRVSLGGGNSRVSLGKGFLKGTEISTEVQHFELNHDPSFWTDHNVQVLIRIRPLSSMEKLSQGSGRCLKQETAQTLVWLGHPETRFTFDHIGCETLSQENLFRVAGVPMVENCLSGYNSCMFAYGQTGSGKTYTMMGEIEETQGCLDEDSGITPRVFDYLFTRIKVEEESRKDCKLKYTCKCSFLEIYNEQITDLLEPSATNLQLREDMKKGVYVDNLTEHCVVTVNDVLRLLVQGTANRKVAATHMNCESSRSHSVFTCIIESQWEKDSMTHFRFARLNLVDLAGSERQKSSGADSERLKEAANINKSLSTLGLVIMTLVDLAHGKPRHVPYRDSRLTFLLQDSLGGNSKTMIIANVSPSICSANETLSTLKFAQRAKLIQNNAKVNEDASGDISALQWQIQQLKGQLSFMMKNNFFPTPVSNLEPNSDSCRLREVSEDHASVGEKVTTGHKLLTPNKEIKCLKAALVGALRREKMAETTIQDLNVEIERTKCLAQQKEEDAQHTSIMLRLCDEKIKQLELLVDGQLSTEKYLMEENRALHEELQLLKMKIDKHSESSRLALENDRLLQQLQIFQNFYEHGEREKLLTEISELRDQLLGHLQEKITVSMKNENQDIDATQVLEDCQNMNSKLLRDVAKLQTELGKYLNYNQVKSNSVLHSSVEHPDEFLTTDKCSLVETISVGSDSGDEMPSSTWEANALANIIEGNTLSDLAMCPKDNEYMKNKVLEAKLEKMSKDLEEVRLLNDKYQEKCALQLSQKQQTERVCQDVELETTNTILHLQEEVAGLQSELEGKLCSIAQENTDLRNVVAAKEEEMRSLCLNWENAILELTTFLLEGSRSLKDACGQVQNISSSFPKVNAWISEHVGMAVKKYIEKEETIHQLHSSLEDARKLILDMELKICSLREATVTLSALEHLDNENGIEEAIQLRVLLNEKTNMIRTLEKEIKYKNDQLCKADKQVNVAFLVAKWLSDTSNAAQINNDAEDISIPDLERQGRLGSCNTSENLDVGCNLLLNDLMDQVELTNLAVLEMENVLKAIFVDTEMQTAGFQTGVFDLFSVYKDLFQDIVKETKDMRKEIRDLKMHHINPKGYTVDSRTLNTNNCQVFADQHHSLFQLKEQLIVMNKSLNIIENCVSQEVDVSRFQLVDEDFIDADELSTDSSSVSDISTETESVASGSKSGEFTNNYDFELTREITEEKVHLNPESNTITQSDDACNSSNTGKFMKKPIYNEAGISCLRRELNATYDGFQKLYICLSPLLKELDDGSCSYQKELEKVAPSSRLRMQKDEADYESDTEVCNYMDIKPGDRFLTKFMEAHATVKEADFTLHALTKAFEDSKQLTAMWKQAGENLMIERENLADEIQKLKSSTHHKEEENRLLKDHINFSLIEMTSSFSMLEECFLQMQIDVEKKFMTIYSDVLQMGQEIQYFMNSLKSSVEDIFSQIVDGGFVSFTLYSCCLTELVSKFTGFSVNHELQSAKQGEFCNLPKSCSSIPEPVPSTVYEGVGKIDHHLLIQNVQEEPDLPNVRVLYENMDLKKELERKQELLEGLFFDFRLLQESASNSKEIKDQTEKLIFSLSQARHELEIKTNQLDDMLVQNRKLEASLADTEKALTISNYELGLAKESIEKFSDQNEELRELLKELYGNKVEAEEQLDEHKEVIKGLEKEIDNLTASVENQSLSLFESIENELNQVMMERDELHEKVHVLNDKLDMAYSLVDEKEAIAVEARQESESSKFYAEQKEEEVKILEHSVEELESTINVLEKKVYDMDEEVGRHRSISDSLKVELQALTERLLLVESLPQNSNSESMSVQTGDKIYRQLPSKVLELHEALKLLEKENAEKDQEIKKCKEYISEIVLHAEAQASQYQQKYKCLESMFREVKTDVSYSTSMVPTSEKMEKTSTRARGSSSPFRCISNLVQQMNQEKDQELAVARCRVEELEALSASRQKEVCMLRTRLAATESMTHDVIRDLLGVKLDITNYANLIDQNQIVKLVEEAHHQREEIFLKEKENLDLRLHINDLIEERESCISELKIKEADMLATQIAVQQLQERDQMLSAQNEMLKMEKTNLMRKVAELDDMVKTVLGTRNYQHVPQSSKTKDKGPQNVGNVRFTKRLSQYERLSSSRVNEDLTQRRKSSGNNLHG
ncbi:kinesin-like protein KIN-12C isoform X2 [Cicer arietinum]|uniref:Kinesin-like protein KIN-12C isoform X2 n=1 Tax=Cicer arietinum TaxID=3827 RepID=A0A3Q7XVL9_CICAR|nr:kinesin-like protein KIN-12C isoform X2 [Cicer arietinum]